MSGGAENRTGGPFDPPAEPELEDYMRAIARQIKLTMRTHVPAKIVAYNPATQTATVEVATLAVVRVTDPTKIPARIQSLEGTPPNALATLQPLLLKEIPVAFPRTKAGYFTLPLVAGDTGELHVHDRSLEQWKLLGIACDPVLAFTHALKDSVFHPGLAPTTSPIAPPTDLTAAVVEATQVKLGRTATESAVKAESLVTALVSAVTASAVGSMDGGATFKANLIAQLATILTSISSTKVKVDS